ncbi:hypothetical protein KDH_05510 [Dictyobacter sp. S3.2.2.5]|uniref:Uncharacterized protein n=1 Tax=Dictyobacter halimunensis TaxID=3026934 RepID=A0ABQ6FMM5_9CHLR|nr:hypothetical protein KDH_05510 [Dictyobacter sp. S3.2.2.5]
MCGERGADCIYHTVYDVHNRRKGKSDDTNCDTSIPSSWYTSKVWYRGITDKDGTALGNVVFPYTNPPASLALYDAP